jgi:hypothetical protein
MSGALLTDRELDNIYTSYKNYGPERLGDFIRSIWKEAYEEAYDAGYKKGVVEGFNSGRLSR